MRLYTITNLFAEIGGYLGLLLGESIFSYCISGGNLIENLYDYILKKKMFQSWLDLKSLKYKITSKENPSKVLSFALICFLPVQVKWDSRERLKGFVTQKQNFPKLYLATQICFVLCKTRFQVQIQNQNILPITKILINFLSCSVTLSIFYKHRQNN